MFYFSLVLFTISGFASAEESLQDKQNQFLKSINSGAMLWRVAKEVKGFWFSNMGIHIIKPRTVDSLECYTENLNQIDWVKFEEIGKCFLD